MAKWNYLIESDAQRRKLYKEYLASGDTLALNRALKMLVPSAKQETDKLIDKVLTRINRNRVFKFKVQFSHTFVGPSYRPAAAPAPAWVFSQIRLNTNTSSDDDKKVPASARGAFTLLLYFYLNDDKTIDWVYGYGNTQHRPTQALSQALAVARSEGFTEETDA